MAGAGKTVCVTGASGFIASWLVKVLLQRGYTVRATVRSLNDPRKTEHLLALDGAKERLYLFEANLLGEGSFDSVVEGCDGVFHTASPVIIKTTNPQEDLIDPAVKGTVNVLKSCAKVPSIRRVIITSSMASVLFTGKPLKDGVVLDETWFSDPNICEQSKLWYPLSKTLADNAALELAKENGIDLVTLHPGWVLGPILQPTLNLSSEGILDFIKTGKDAYADGIYRYVDVRDVVYAHVYAFENPSASGRYLLVETVTHSSEVAKIIRKHFPTLTLSENCNSDKTIEAPYKVSNERARSLGINFTPLEISVKDTVESLKEKKYLDF